MVDADTLTRPSVIAKKIRGKRVTASKKASVSDVAMVLLAITGRTATREYKEMMVFADLLSSVFTLAQFIAEIDSRYGISVGWLFDANTIGKDKDMDLHTFAGHVAKEVNAGGLIGLEKVKRQLMSLINIPYETFHDEMTIFGDLLFSELDIMKLRCLLEDSHGIELPDDFEDDLIKNNRKVSLRDFARGLCSRINAQ